MKKKKLSDNNFEDLESTWELRDWLASRLNYVTPFNYVILDTDVDIMSNNLDIR